MCATRAFIDMEQSPDLEPRQQAGPDGAGYDARMLVESSHSTLRQAELAAGRLSSSFRVAPTDFRGPFPTAYTHSQGCSLCL
jgi:hypothetical protein